MLCPPIAFAVSRKSHSSNVIRANTSVILITRQLDNVDRHESDVREKKNREENERNREEKEKEGQRETAETQRRPEVSMFSWV